MDVRTSVDVSRVWDDVWSNDGQGFAYWVGEVRDVAGEPINLIVPQGFKVYDFGDGIWHEVTLEKLCEAWLEVHKQGLTHCGGYALSESDACTEDYYMQFAVFGELVYG
jgi:hypothetical protein